MILIDEVRLSCVAEETSYGGCYANKLTSLKSTTFVEFTFFPPASTVFKLEMLIKFFTKLTLKPDEGEYVYIFGSVQGISY